jgi:hypothetical protein
MFWFEFNLRYFPPDDLHGLKAGSFKKMPLRIIYERSKRQPEKGADFSNNTTI